MTDASQLGKITPSFAFIKKGRLSLIHCRNRGSRLDSEAATTMDGLRKFFKALMKESNRITDSMEQHLMSKESQEAWRNHLFNLSGPRSSNRRLTPYEETFRNVFYGFSEVFESYERLKDFPSYLKQFRFAGSRVTPARHLRYTVENYLAEMYILQQRLLAYAERLRRYVKKRHHSPAPQTAIDRIEQMVKTSLRPLAAVRGAHVHDARYTDDDLKRLDTLELLVLHGRMQRLRRWYRSELSRIQRKWRDTVRGNNREVKKMLDHYFDGIRPFVFGPTVYLIGRHGMARPNNGMQPAAEDGTGVDRKSGRTHRAADAGR